MQSFRQIGSMTKRKTKDRPDPGDAERSFDEVVKRMLNTRPPKKRKSTKKQKPA